MADKKPEDKKPIEDPNLEKGKDLGGDEVQDKMDEETEQGYRGLNVDPTPDEHYTVAGVTASKPTPETDAKAAQKAAEVAGLAKGVDATPSKPAETVKLRNGEGHEIEVSHKLRSNYPGYKEVK